MQSRQVTLLESLAILVVGSAALEGCRRDRPAPLRHGRLSFRPPHYLRGLARTVKALGYVLEAASELIIKMPIRARTEWVWNYAHLDPPPAFGRLLAFCRPRRISADAIPRGCRASFEFQRMYCSIRSRMVHGSPGFASMALSTFKGTGSPLTRRSL